MHFNDDLFHSKYKKHIVSVHFCLKKKIYKRLNFSNKYTTFLLCNTLFYDDMRFMYVCFDILMLHRDVSDPPCAKADSFRQSTGWMDKPKDIWHVKNL